MKNEDLEEDFERYFYLTFGYYNLSRVEDPKTLSLSKFVKNEVFQEGGEFYELFNELGRLKDEIYKIECKFKKYDSLISQDESLRYQIGEVFDDILLKVCRRMFMYGVLEGISL